ncbi:MAG: dockerin type I domain-containing protein [Bacilli bacterium]
MKKIVSYLLVFSFIFNFLAPITEANTTKKGKVNSSNGIRVRQGPSTTYNTIDDGLGSNQIVTILDTVKSDNVNDTCDSKLWYKIVYITSSSEYSYACTSYIDIVEDKPIINYNFEEELKKFPVSYHLKLRQLHETYPNAVFLAYNAVEKNNSPMTFNNLLVNQTNSLGKNLLWDSNNSREGYKNLKSYNYDTDTFYNDYPGGGSNWYSPNDDVVAYNIDPRNFLENDTIFMFERLSYNNSFYDINGIESILKGSYMANSYVDGKTEHTFANTMMDAGVTNNINPYFLASRILQEVGYSRSSLVKGTYPKYPQFNGYYNYYNIGAGGKDVVFNGLTKAVKEGWNSEYKAIVNGASWIGDGYISIGQDTQYFQKWDVICHYSYCYSNQYMQNLEAPVHEGIKTYDGYKKTLGSNFYQTPFVFTIPIYKDMPVNTSLPSILNPNNYLSRLVVDGISIPNFNGATTTYNLNIPLSKSSINIEATALTAHKGATVTGTGNIAINGKEEVVNIEVTAANGSKRTYTINVHKVNDTQLSLEDTIKNIKGATIDNIYISGLTNADTMLDAILKANSMSNVVIKDNKGNVVTTGSLGTDYKVSITAADSTKEFNIVIYGDTNGDTETTILDLLRVQKHLLGSTNLSDTQLKASDVNKDGKVTILDLLRVQKHLLGSIIISQ